jgi:hypothetical protein
MRDLVKHHRHKHGQRPDNDLADDLFQDGLAGESHYEYGKVGEKTRSLDTENWSAGVME